MTSTLRLFGIEARRNAALWFVPIIVAVAWWMLDSQGWTTFLWDSTNRLLRNVVVPFAGPAMAGIAAWMAGRDQRRGIGDLLSTTPYSATARRLNLWAATAFWGILAYALFALYMMGQTTFQATWGGPEFWPVAIVVLAILAMSAWGFFVGGLIPSRFTAPIAGIAVLGLQQFPAQYSQALPGGGSMSSWANNLAAHNGHSEWHGLLYLGLTGAGLAAITLIERRNIVPIAMFACTLLLAVGSVVMIWGQYPRLNQQVIVTDDGTATFVTPDPVPRNNFGQVMTFPDREPPEPVCEGSPVTICTHPAYQPVLNEAIANAAKLVEPLLGLPNVPMRIEDGRGVAFTSGDSARIDLSLYADMLVANDDTLQHGNLKNPPQIAIRDWLMQRAGLPQWIDCDGNLPDPESHPSSHNLGWSTRETCGATAHFDQLSDADQRAWLEAHYTDLRAGNLTLDDLP